VNRTNRPQAGVQIGKTPPLPHGKRALSGSNDKTLRLWDLDTGAELGCFTSDSPIFEFGHRAGAKTGCNRRLNRTSDFAVFQSVNFSQPLYVIMSCISYQLILVINASARRRGRWCSRIIRCKGTFAPRTSIF
jgi:hypothetical protein